MSIVERGVTVHDLNMAVLKFLGIADEANDITRVEVHVGVDEFPKVVITKLMRHTDKVNYPMSRVSVGPDGCSVDKEYRLVPLAEYDRFVASL